MDSVRLRKMCVAPTLRLKEAIRQLNENAKRILLVVDARDVLIGTVTDGDIRRGLLHPSGFDGAIETVMTRAYTALARSEPDLVGRARVLMLEHGLIHIPILDEASRVCDLILWEDVLGAGQPVVEAMPQKNTVVIMAGGKGTRLDPFTQVLPKPLVPIAGKPAVELIMERFAAHGFRRFVYTLNYKKEYLKLFLKERDFPYDISWVEEEEYLGTAGSLSLLKGKVDGSLFVVNCDTLLDLNFAEVLEWHQNQQAPLTIIGAHNEVHVPFGVLTLNQGSLEQIHEKPVHDVMVNTGMYVMEPSVLSDIPEATKLDMNELINTLTKRGRVSVYPVYGRDWVDIGGWDSYRNATQQLEPYAQ